MSKIVLSKKLFFIIAYGFKENKGQENKKLFLSLITTYTCLSAGKAKTFRYSFIFSLVICGLKRHNITKKGLEAKTQNPKQIQKKHKRLLSLES